MGIKESKKWYDRLSSIITLSLSTRKKNDGGKWDAKWPFSFPSSNATRSNDRTTERGREAITCN